MIQVGGVIAIGEDFAEGFGAARPTLKDVGGVLVGDEIDEIIRCLFFGSPQTKKLLTIHDTFLNHRRTHGAFILTRHFDVITRLALGRIHIADLHEVSFGDGAVTVDVGPNLHLHGGPKRCLHGEVLSFGHTGTAAATPALAQGQRPPNILYIHSHDTGRYIQPYGHAVLTPNLQKLASAGVLFRHACDAAPTCSPSRAPLLTGMCPHSNGMLGLAHRGFALNDYSRHIIHTLRPAGYTSALFGVQHIGKSGAQIGYEHVEQFKGGNYAADVGPAAVKWLRSPPKQPFFLDIGFQETHREFPKPGPAEDPRYAIPPAAIVDMEQSPLDMAGFNAGARILDTAIGQVLDALEAAGLAETR